MYFSDRELRDAIERGRLIVDPKPDRIDSTSIDLHLDSIAEAKIWNIDSYCADCSDAGHKPNELAIGKFIYPRFAPKYLIAPPSKPTAESLVFVRGSHVVIKPGGFLLWQTKETVGTPEDGADLICFIDGKSTRARTGLLVHLTAPTIHASWSGKVTLEIANLGPFHFVLEENDVIAQITVAQITSPPAQNMKHVGSATFNQTEVTGQAERRKS